LHGVVAEFRYVTTVGCASSARAPHRRAISASVFTGVRDVSPSFSFDPAVLTNHAA